MQSDHNTSNTKKNLLYCNNKQKQIKAASFHLFTNFSYSVQSWCEIIYRRILVNNIHGGQILIFFLLTIELCIFYYLQVDISQTILVYKLAR